MSYRPEIDGLRAIAILAVLLFHLSPSYLPGGFVGVDVFFVLSGYLITASIQQQVATSGFSFRAFYLRRVRRLLPALFAVLFACLVMGYLVLPSWTVIGLAREVMFAGLSISNVLFWTQAGYFDGNVYGKPLLHTWSLGIEEQFYLIWPVVLVLLLRWRHGRWALPVTVLLTVLSLLASQWLVRNGYVTTAFYLLPFRAFELGIGALVWFLHRSSAAQGRVGSEVASVAGLGMMVWAMLAYSSQTPFPGVHALVPCFGAALLLHARGPSFSGQLLRCAPMRYLGLISYSVYLVHWPLIAFHVIAAYEPPTPGEAVLLGMASIVLGAVLYHLVEVPMRWRRAGSRRVRVWSHRRFARVFLTLVMATCALAAHAWTTAGWPWRFPKDPAVLRLLADREPDRWTHPELERPAARIAIIGDSHASALYNGFATWAEPRQIQVDRIYLGGGCPALLGVAVAGIADERERCRERKDPLLTMVAGRPYDVVILVSRWGMYTSDNSIRQGQQQWSLEWQWGKPVHHDLDLSRRAFVVGLRDTVRLLGKSGASILFVGQVPPLGRNPYGCIEHQSTLTDVMHRCRSLGYEWAMSESAWATAAAHQLSEVERFHVFDPTPVFCQEQQCVYRQDDRMLYIDGDHLSTYGATLVVDALRPQLETLLAEP